MQRHQSSRSRPEINCRNQSEHCRNQTILKKTKETTPCSPPFKQCIPLPSGKFRFESMVKLLCFNHWNLKIGGPVLLRIKATPVDISCSPKHHSVENVYQIIFLEYLTLVETKRRKRIF